MSAAATAAGYLYASGRLRGRNARDEEHGQPQAPEQKPRPARRREVKVAVYPPESRDAREPAPQERPKVAPKIQYRTRRWKPE